MIRRVLLVARYAFLEGVRAKFFLGAVLSSVFIVGIASVMASIPYGRVDELIARIGWGAVMLTGLVVSIFYTIQVLARERDAKILALMLSKPVSRSGYALGKVLGISVLSTAAIFAEGAVLMALVTVLGDRTYIPILEWALTSAAIALKCGVMVVFAAFFATVFPTPMVAMLASVVYYLVGAGSDDFVSWARYVDSPALILISQVLRWIAPQFGLFDVEAWVSYHVAVAPSVYAYALAYYLGYAMIGLSCTLAVAETREVL